MIGLVSAVVLAMTSVVLFVFGTNLLYLTFRAIRLPPPPRRRFVSDQEPVVCIQVPIYNERYVAERVIDAVCSIDWPRDRLHVQVLDDSDDETTHIAGKRIARWQRKGLHVDHVRRRSRNGFKAGALAFGLERTDARLIAIFDADFVPAPDFLRRTIGAFDEPSVGFVQARWGHLDEGYTLFTRLQAMAIDFHFLIEQPVRSAAGYFTNFTGTAGVWRRAAIEDAGGWSARTLTEDLDLSYRAQLRGWKSAYIEELVVPEELPVSIDAYRRQQSRWATGSFQSAFRLLGPVIRSTARAAVKFQAAIHLLAYGVGPVMLVQLACYPLLLLTLDQPGLKLPWYLTYASAISIVVGVTPWVGFIAAQTRRGRRWWAGLPAVFCQVVGAGMSLNTLLSLARAAKPGGVFVRTPKHRIVKAGQEWRNQAYVRVGDPRALIEAIAGLGALAMVPVALDRHQVLIAIYSGMFALGFLAVAGLSLVDLLEVLTLRRLGARALARIQRGAPVAALFGLASLLLLTAAQMREPFEDGYGHWLVAANLAATGHLHDPLFSMEDTWLPGYHVLAAAVLRLFGLWQIGALKAVSALLGVAAAACVYGLAPNVRQARLAVGLLVLNPVFLFTSGSAVVEPLLTALLMASALAAVRGRMKLAALLAALACVTSTKAWVWIAAAAAFTVFEILRSRTAGRAGARAMAWAVPALGILLFFQLGFAPVTNSMARGSIEVMSASVRGSIPPVGIERVLELGTTFGLAALPLFALGTVGAVTSLRSRHTKTWKFVYFPALAYLGVVFALVAAGTYSGSHRYLYPALPALALLAAGVLDRHRVAIGSLALGATAMLAVAFLPIFSSFADANSGLVAAGRAVAGSSRMLLTDSPTAAYYSGRQPAEITGSQALPAGRTQALAWMRSHGVSMLVVENISYYRATELFPDLAQGKPTMPFVSAGPIDAYRVSGGKAVFAYRLLPDLTLDPASPGKTAPLAKGLTMGTAGTGEGMGFGVPIVRYRDGWVYSRTSSTVATTATSWKRTFQLDEMGGDAAHSYKFVPIASRGAVEVTYTLDGTGVAITVKPLWLQLGYSEVGILNEQSADFNDFAADGQPTLTNAAFGNWIPVTGSWARLRSGSLGVEWSLPAVAGASLYAGRELAAPAFDWAGLDYIFPSKFDGATYHINIQEAN